MGGAWSNPPTCRKRPIGSERIGKEPVVAITEVHRIETSPVTDARGKPPAVAGTQDAPLEETSATNDVIDVNLSESPPVLP